MLLEANDSILCGRVACCCSSTMLQFKLTIVLGYSGLDLVSCFYRCPFESWDASRICPRSNESRPSQRCHSKLMMRLFPDSCCCFNIE